MPVRWLAEARISTLPALAVTPRLGLAGLAVFSSRSISILVSLKLFADGVALRGMRTRGGSYAPLAAHCGMYFRFRFPLLLPVGFGF
jgi:hypothetical protein